MTIGRYIVVSVLDKNDKTTTDHFYNDRTNSMGKCIDLNSVKCDNFYYLYDNDEILADSYISPIIDRKLMIALYDLEYLEEFLNNNNIPAKIEYPENLGTIPFIVIKN